MKYTKFMFCQIVTYSASNFHFIQNVYCASLCVCQNVHIAVPCALIYTMFISTDYTPVTCFIFYSSARGLQLLLPFKGLFRWRLHSRITSLWQLANIRHGSAEYEAMWQHKLTLLLQFTVGTRWMCASLWQFFARSVVGIREPERTHYTCDIWRSEGEDWAGTAWSKQRPIEGAARMRNCGSIPDTGTRSLHSEICEDRLWGSSGVRFNAYHEPFLLTKTGQGENLTSHTSPPTQNRV